MLLSYGLARSAIDSLLLEDHGKEAMKYAYGLVAVGAALVVALYSKAAARRSIGTLLTNSAALTATTLAILLAMRSWNVPYASYGLYVWKDVYVVVLIELLWTLANSAFKQSTAKWAYGFFCMAGSLGDMSGSYLGASLAHRLGSAQLLWLILPVMVLVALVGRRSAQTCGWPSPNREQSTSAWKILRDSRPIQMLLIAVVVIQISTTLIDYSYRVTALEAYRVLDDRTAAFAHVDMFISATAMFLQLVSGLVVLIIGLRVLFILLPIVVGLSALYYGLHPEFASIALLKIVNKSLDYSLFRTSKELLYRPLSYAERSQGKAIVDVFGYRAAKGGTSGILVAMSGSLALVSLAILGGVAVWLLVAIRLAALRPQVTERLQGEAPDSC